MDVTGLQIGFDALLSILSAFLGAVTVWFTLKNKVTIQQLLLDNLSKEVNERLHKRIDDLKVKVEVNREKNDQAINQLREDMAQMKIDIIEAIHAIRK
jgi:gas vesicle protein